MIIPKILITLWIIQTVSAIGMFIDPIQRSDKSKYSSLKNLKHCLSYATTNDELILIKVRPGEKLPSQSLNLKIFDSEDNVLRIQNDVSQEVSLILKNLNSPLQPKQSRSNIIDRLSNFGSKDPEKLNALLESGKGKNLIYVCFDNIYSDKSWSFSPKTYEILVDVNLRDVSAMKNTDYNLYSKYFNKFISGEDHHIKDMNENDFDNEINVVENELNNVVENLQNSELLLKNILQQESKLRDANEEIYSAYTISSIIILIVIGLFGISHTMYLRYYLKRKLL